jgi:hypothetical protein
MIELLLYLTELYRLQAAVRDWPEFDSFAVACQIESRAIIQYPDHRRMRRVMHIRAVTVVFFNYILIIYSYICTATKFTGALL